MSDHGKRVQRDRRHKVGDARETEEITVFR